MKIKIRNALIIFNSVFIILTAVTVIILYSNGAKKSVYSISEKYMKEVLTSVKSSTETFFTSVENANRDIAVHFWTPEFNAIFQNEDVAFEYFKQIGESYNEFEMIYFAGTSGEMVMARRVPDGSYSKRCVSNDGVVVHDLFYHKNQEYNSMFPSSTKPVGQGYDPRTRGWYKAAVEKKQMIWTDIYFFATGNKPGISCALPLYTRDSQLIGVSCIDVGVEGLSSFLSEFSLTPNSQLFILDSEGNILAEPLKNDATVDSLFSITTDENGKEIRSLRKLSEQDAVLATSYGLFEQEKNNSIKDFSAKGKKYFSLYETIQTASGLNVCIGLVIPDEDIMGLVYANNFRVLVISIFFVLVVIILSGFISKTIAKPMNALSLEMDKIKSFSLDSNEAVNSVITEIDDMVSSFESMKKGINNFQKYVPSKLVNELIDNDQLAMVGGQKKELTIFFSDIENFTNISELMNPEQMIEQMNDYFSAISNTIIENEGTLDKYIGDAVMAFWGAPTPNPNHAVCACRSALICQELIFDLCHRWDIAGRPMFKTRMGLHTDTVVVGNMGYEKRINYTVIGDGVNLASRLEGINKFYGTKIVISESTYAQVKDYFETRMLDRITVKGKSQPIHIFELLAEKGKLNDNDGVCYSLYENGLRCYFKGDWGRSITFMEQMIALKEDKPARIILDRSRMYLKNPPASWNGVHQFTEK